MKYYSNLYRALGFTCFFAGLSPALAQKLTLADLPVGCIYTDTMSRTLTNSIKIPAATPIFGEIGEGLTPIINVNVQCRGKINQDVIIGLQETGTLNWLGAGRDILATDMSGIGVRLSVEGISEKGQCVNTGTVSAGRHPQCVLKNDTDGKRSLNFQVKAQLIKISDNTPIQQQKTLRVDNNGSVTLTTKGVNQTYIDVFNSGLLSPEVATEASCTLVTPKDRNINFGTINRPSGGVSEITLGQVQSTPIEVSCSPLRDQGANNYNVAVTFTAGEMKPGDDTALATNINDMVIRFSKSNEGSEWLKFGSEHGMVYNPAKSGERSQFGQDFYWFLRYLPAEAHNQTGKFNAVATYTITVQ